MRIKNWKQLPTPKPAKTAETSQTEDRVQTIPPPKAPKTPQAQHTKEKNETAVYPNTNQTTHPQTVYNTMLQTSDQKAIQKKAKEYKKNDSVSHSDKNAV